MHRYEATISWNRDGAAFTDNRYSRAHEWSFDGGVRVPASSSPAVVREPMSQANAVDPEEALVAATASCHMLWFLSLAAKRGYVVERYEDAAFGTMDEVDGKVRFTKVTLRPAIAFAGPKQPDAAALAALHERAHAECFIANSLRCPVVVETGGAVGAT
ncbi:MAG TPA: OsmC family protein [Xanthomonadales bacterium]|nr:OsmC family protein [Xanthomonadales bacterium]